MTVGVRDERGEEQNRKEGENEMWELGDIDEKVILWFFNLCDDKGWVDGEFDVHCDPFGSPGTPLKACNQT